MIPGRLIKGGHLIEFQLSTVVQFNCTIWKTD